MLRAGSYLVLQQRLYKKTCFEINLQFRPILLLLVHGVCGYAVNLVNIFHCSSL